MNWEGLIDYLENANDHFAKGDFESSKLDLICAIVPLRGLIMGRAIHEGDLLTIASPDEELEKTELCKLIREAI